MNRNGPYSKADIIEKVQAALKDPASLYRQNFLNYTGSVDGERYTELIAAELLKNIHVLQSIPTITREESYKTPSHPELATRIRPLSSGREEEWIAIGMYGKTFKWIGEIIDFQTPLKNKASDDAGKIDLLSYDKETNIAFILELKTPDSQETHLRSALEAYAYWKTVDHQKLLRDFGIEGARLHKAVLLINNSKKIEDHLASGSDRPFDFYKAAVESNCCIAQQDFARSHGTQAQRLIESVLSVDFFLLNAAKTSSIYGFVTDDDNEYDGYDEEYTDI